MTKTQYIPEPAKFNSNFLIAGEPGAGKTVFCGRYEQGPVHFYVLDKNGLVSLNKFIAKRPNSKYAITYDDLSNDQTDFSTLFHQLQRDEKEGFFQEMADQNGLCVIDSLTTVNERAFQEITEVNGLYLGPVGHGLDLKKGWQKPHWGQLRQWLSLIVSCIQDEPCAFAMTVHIDTVMNDAGVIVGRYPSISGKLKAQIGKDFDECYLLTRKGNVFETYMTEYQHFIAKTCLFEPASYTDISMNDIALAIKANKTKIK